MARMAVDNKLRDKTIADFGDQWTTYTDNSGWYGSTELFRTILGPIVSENEIRGKRVADVGSGTGRIVNMLLSLGADHVTAIEPSDAFTVLKQNTRHAGDKVTCLQLRGDQIPENDFDHVLCIGVIIIIPDPKPVVEAAYRAIKPGGRYTIWLYGKEGNELYLSIFLPVMSVTRHLPHKVLAALCWALTVPLALYIAGCRLFNLPMREYMVRHLGPMTWDKRQLTIYDQLNPSYVKYYTRQEAVDLLKSAGFENIEIYPRLGYSYTLTATKPVR
jgi:SAM-dependent methyltransferase